ncbi:MAG: hypothetical protein KatS3mg061_3144 [Dehalococcoidia bacterium]|nr:MAG: hypothetical protein KatS3mg061_3144 [Dehalococcoidia bacterium]
MTTVILFDVDYTLFDTERFRATISTFAGERSFQLWEAYAAVRATEPTASLPAALARLASNDPATAQALTTALAQLDYRRFLVPGVEAVLAAARALGQPVILSEGDPLLPAGKDPPRRARRGGRRASARLPGESRAPGSGGDRLSRLPLLDGR